MIDIGLEFFFCNVGYRILFTGDDGSSYKGPGSADYPHEFPVNSHFYQAKERLEFMRDKRFVTEHRGGPLKKEQHRQLMTWAINCALHILPLFNGEPDGRLSHTLEVAKAWEQGKASVGDARKASVACLALARELKDTTSINIVRAIGHAVATAHMADHALGPALYGLKAVRSAGGEVKKERRWQNAQLPEEIKELVLSARLFKEKHMGL